MQDNRALRVCPHCAKPLQPIRYGVPFGPLAVQIIDTVTHAGSDGIHIEHLFATIYRDRAGATVDRLKSYIGSINAALADRGVAIRFDRHSNHIVVRPRV